MTCVPWYAGPRVSILSGTERGITLGTPIGLFVPNQNVRPMDYSEMSTVPRPGHAEYTYELKYGTRASSIAIRREYQWNGHLVNVNVFVLKAVITNY